MPRYTTISPTHVTGEKEYAWNNFLKGEYIAIGWMHVDLTGKSIEEVISIIREQESEFSTIKNGDRVDALDVKICK